MEGQTERELVLHSPVNKDQLAAFLQAPGWRTFRKTSLTRAIRVSGPFEVETSESPNAPFKCEDGWLAVDARGYPYAIAVDEFERIYEPVYSGADDREALELIMRAKALMATLPGTRERALVLTKLDEARMWLVASGSEGRTVPGTVVHTPKTGGPPPGRVTNPTGGPRP